MTTAFLGGTEIPQFLKNDGTINAGGKLQFFEAGTTTAKNVYADSGLQTSLGSEVTLDAAGRASVWLNGAYKLRVLDAALAQLWELDRVNEQSVATVITLSANKTLTKSDSGSIVVVPALYTVTLPDAATAGIGWAVTIVNTHTVAITVARLNAANTINGVAADVTVAASASADAIVSGSNGFSVASTSILSANNTWTGVNTFAQPVVVANATASNHAYAKGQVDALDAQNAKLTGNNDFTGVNSIPRLGYTSTSASNAAALGGSSQSVFLLQHDTSNVTITTFGTPPPSGSRCFEVWMSISSGTVTLATSGNMILPGGANISVQNGDCFRVISQPSNAWVVVNYQRNVAP